MATCPVCGETKFSGQETCPACGNLYPSPSWSTAGPVGDSSGCTGCSCSGCLIALLGIVLLPALIVGVATSISRLLEGPNPGWAETLACGWVDEGRFEVRGRVHNTVSDATRFRVRASVWDDSSSEYGYVEVAVPAEGAKDVVAALDITPEQATCTVTITDWDAGADPVPVTPTTAVYSDEQVEGRVVECRSPGLDTGVVSVVEFTNPVVEPVVVHGYVRLDGAARSPFAVEVPAGGAVTTEVFAGDGSGTCRLNVAFGLPSSAGSE